MRLMSLYTTNDVSPLTVGPQFSKVGSLSFTSTSFTSRPNSLSAVADLALTVIYKQMHKKNE